MLSLLVICREALSYYEDNSSPNEGEFEAVRGEAAVAANDDVEKIAAASPNEEVGDAVYQRDTADLWYSKNDPQLLVQPLMNRKRANPVSHIPPRMPIYTYIYLYTPIYTYIPIYLYPYTYTRSYPPLFPVRPLAAAPSAR